MKRSTFKTIVLVFGLTVCMSNSSFAQSQNRQQKTPPTFSELLKELDANDDGKLSEEELKGPLKDNFDKVDTDEDGFITEEEFDKAPKPKGRGKR
ncbi:EF-hand domain-containing protein [Lacinutrix sp. MEBiC02404]